MTGRGDLGSGEAGRSARRESERIRKRRLEHAPASGWARLLATLYGPSAQERQMIARERRWATGARGEELVAESLVRRCPSIPLLHDRAMPGSRANIDHIAISASGVYVIDAKRYRGKIEVREPLFGSPTLRIAGRNQTKLIDGLGKQIAVVEAALAEVAPKVPVHGCFCFVAPEGRFAGSGLPVIRTLSISGYPLYYPRRLAKKINRPGPLMPEQASRIHAELAQRLPPA